MCTETNNLESNALPTLVYSYLEWCFAYQVHTLPQSRSSLLPLPLVGFVPPATPSDSPFLSGFFTGPGFLLSSNWWSISKLPSAKETSAKVFACNLLHISKHSGFPVSTHVLSCLWKCSSSWIFFMGGFNFFSNQTIHSWVGSSVPLSYFCLPGLIYNLQELFSLLSNLY